MVDAAKEFIFSHQPFFMRYNFLFLIVLIIVSSCKTESDVVVEVPLTKDQQHKLDMTAVSMMDAIASNRPEVIMNNFDHKSFSKRLGQRFFQFNAQEQSYLMGILINALGENITALTSRIANQGLTVRLKDSRQEGPVSIVTLDVIDSEKTQVFSYIVLYLKENKDREFVLVNYYNVYDGKSFGQFAKEMLNTDFESEHTVRNLERAQNNVEMAQYLEVNGEFESAYNQMNTINDAFKNYGQFPIYRAQLAMQVNDSVYLNELENLKSITPNDQSRKFYECEMLAIMNNDDNQSECMTQFEIMLLGHELEN